MWEKLPNQKVAETIWSQADEERWDSQLDFSEIDSLFQQQAAPQATTKEEKKVDPKKAEISVIDSKKAYNMSMLCYLVSFSFG